MTVEIPDQVYAVIRMTLFNGRVIYTVKTINIKSHEDYVRTLVLHDGNITENKQRAINEARRRNHAMS